MKKIYLLLSLAALLFGACGENDNNFTPSDGERNWLIVEDTPNDPIDHQRYLIFQETGIPIYYNDTIGSEERYSYATGDPYTYYEVLQVFYSPGNSTPQPSNPPVMPCPLTGKRLNRYWISSNQRYYPSCQKTFTYQAFC